MDSSLIKVLIVDDERGVVEAMERRLKRRKFQVLKASNSDEALKIFEQEKPDICILDVLLGMGDSSTGVDILEKIKQSNSKARCILLSAVPEEEEIIKRGKELGAIYLKKPSMNEEWLKAICDFTDDIYSEKK